MNTLQRWATHLWLDADDVRRRLSKAGLQRLEVAVRASEARHLGELRLCVEGGLPWSHLRRACTPRERAVELFSQLRVWDTAHNNGVLIYLLLAERRIEILADRGLHERTPEGTWSRLASDMGSALQTGEFEAGLLQAIDQVGALMRAHFPARHERANANELPDAVVVL